ncbi:AhpD-like protein [Xylogone sp. PMI_703]|nr:AhpD-like protein [Xylogone sp. PMI_703]
MRIPYVPNPPQMANPEEEAILNRIQARRGPNGLLKLDLALLHAPQVADGWSSFLGAIRGRTSLPDDLREIAIARAALLLGAWVEWDAHSSILAATEEFKTDGKEKLAVVERVSTAEGPGKLNQTQWAVLRYTDAMTRDVQVPDEIFEELRKTGLSEQAIVEVTATVAAYNCVGRFFVALDISERNGTGPTKH